MRKKQSKRTVDQIDNLIDNFDKYLDNTKGLSKNIRSGSCKYARLFLRSQFESKKTQINRIEAKGVIQFFLKYTENVGPGTAKQIAYSIRSFFRFLKQAGKLTVNLENCIPSVAHWKKNSYPMTLTEEETKRLLDGCDRKYPVGLRDYAVLVLMASLGLRACEVHRLTLGDLDWDNSEIIIRGKGKETRLPILQDVGEALVSYLRHGRPDCSSKYVFIHNKPSFGGLGSSKRVVSILHHALKRAGLNPEKRGTHLLRHSFASTL